MMRILTLMLLVAAAVLSVQDCAAANPNVILGRPTDQSITLSVLSAADINARVDYGLKAGAYTQKTDVRVCKAGVPCEIEIGQLKPNTKYYYRLLTKSSGSTDFKPEPEASFNTQRAPGSAFTFALQGDSHPEREGKMYSPALYSQTMRNVAKDSPDFYITLGDDFSIERLIERQSLSQPAVDRMYAYQRDYLGIVGRSAPVFLVNGNHEQAALCNLDGTPNNPAVLAALSRTRFFPLPAPDAFYHGDTGTVKYVGLLRDYYSWTWGDALFVVIDPYWHSTVAVDNQAGSRAKGDKKGGGGRDLWKATLGNDQYRWLAKTLADSKARWKFVFCHHVLGTGRGGIEQAGMFEWGGKDKRGEASFADKRPGWELPIHQLMVKYGVTILFQGHDHVFARQELDGIVYQECANPADDTYEAFNSAAYRSGDVLPNSGHLRVTVSPESVRVDYVRSFLQADQDKGRTNAAVAYSYSIPKKREGVSK